MITLRDIREATQGTGKVQQDYSKTHNKAIAVKRPDKTAKTALDNGFKRVNGKAVLTGIKGSERDRRNYNRFVARANNGYDCCAACMKALQRMQAARRFVL